MHGLVYYSFKFVYMELPGINVMIILPKNQHIFKFEKKKTLYMGLFIWLDKEIATSGSRQLGVC